MQLLSKSYMYLKPHTRVLFEDNKADYVGGAIYTYYENDYTNRQH
jgi:predicted outer membrane repeat protein